MNILKKHVVYSTVNTNIDATSLLRCPVLYISISDLFSKHFLFPVDTPVCCKQKSFSVLRENTVIKFACSFTDEVEWFRSKSGIKYHHEIKTSSYIKNI